MSSHWFAFATKTPESITNSTSVSFPGSFFFHGLFWNRRFVDVRLQPCKVRQVLIIWSFTFFSSIFFIFRSTVAVYWFIRLRQFMVKLVLSSKFILSFLSLFDILCKKSNSDCFLNTRRYEVNIQYEVNIHQLANLVLSLLRIQWRFTFAKAIRLSRLRLWVGYFMF